MKKMRALLFDKGSLEFRDDYPAPEPAAGEALVRVLCAGVCDSDLEIIDVAPLISKIFPLEQGVEALEYAGQKGVLKVLLRAGER